MSLIDVLQQRLGTDAVRQISQQLGAEHQSAADAAPGVMGMLKTVLDRNHAGRGRRAA
jgi:hypothetical protein